MRVDYHLARKYRYQHACEPPQRGQLDDKWTCPVCDCPWHARPSGGGVGQRVVKQGLPWEPGGWGNESYSLPTGPLHWTFDFMAYERERLVNDVEAALMGHPEVIKCAFVWVTDATRGEIPRIFIELTARQVPTDIFQVCRSLLRGRVRPEALTDPQTIRLSKLPVTSTGAVDKDRLRRRT